MSLQFLQAALENTNVKAFQMCIRFSEGTNALDGYKYLFTSSPSNSRRFEDFSKHPDQLIKTANGYASTAAGAYQILFKTWESIRIKYALPDFSPASQDIACAELISQVNALQLIMDGNFEEGLKLCSPIWASFPFNSYCQPVHPIDQYATWYTKAGGTIAQTTD